MICDGCAPGSAARLAIIPTPSRLSEEGRAEHLDLEGKGEEPDLANLVARLQAGSLLSSDALDARPWTVADPVC